MRRVSLLRLLLAVGAALTLLGCEVNQSTLPAGQRLQITPAAMEYYQQYLRDMGNGGGAFAVSLSGQQAAYDYCPAQRCIGGSGGYAGKALTMCQKGGDKCVLFARDGRILVPYDVVP